MKKSKRRMPARATEHSRRTWPEPIQARYAQLVNDPELDEILDKGAAKAHAKASETYEKVVRAMGLNRK